jgi:hypothetical protein
LTLLLLFVFLTGSFNGQSKRKSPPSKSTSPVKKKRKSAAGGEKSTPKKKRLFKVKKAMQALEEALEEALNDRDRVMSVDECLKAVLALGNEGVAEFQQKLMLAVLKK